MIYFLIFISLTLSAIAAFQFLYLFFLGRVEAEHKKLIKELEGERKDLRAQLQAAEKKIAQQNILIESIAENDEEFWADVIADR